MNTDLRNLTIQTHSGLSWSDIKRQLTDWRQFEGLATGACRISESQAAQQTLKARSHSGAGVKASLSGEGQPGWQ